MNRRTIGIASLIYGVSILLSRLIGLIRESVIGRTLGGGQEADAYWTAFVLPDFLNYLLAGGVLSIVFIPIFAGYITRDDEAGGWLAFSQIANALCLVLIPLTAVLWIMTPEITRWIAPGMTGEQHTLLVELTRIILPAQIFHLLGGLISATLQARDKHLAPALAPILYTGSIVLEGHCCPEHRRKRIRLGRPRRVARRPFWIAIVGCSSWRTQVAFPTESQESRPA